LHANRHPKFLDESGALVAREVILSFQESFLGREDEELGLKLSRQLSGIANRAIAGLRRLRAKDNKFSRGDTAERIADQVRTDQSPALEYSNSCLKVTGDSDDFVTDGILATSYDGWCRTQGIKGPLRRSISQLKNDLEVALRPKVVRTQRRVRDIGEPAVRQRHGLSGILFARDPWKHNTILELPASGGKEDE
jgi:phage/plasmid-associated DNA primase